MFKVNALFQYEKTYIRSVFLILNTGLIVSVSQHTHLIVQTENMLLQHSLPVLKLSPSAKNPQCLLSWKSRIPSWDLLLLTSLSPDFISRFIQCVLLGGPSNTLQSSIWAHWCWFLCHSLLHSETDSEEFPHEEASICSYIQTVLNLRLLVPLNVEYLSQALLCIWLFYCVTITGVHVCVSLCFLDHVIK